MAEALPGPAHAGAEDQLDPSGHPDNPEFVNFPTYRRLRITICGHSQLPDDVGDFDGHHVTTLKHRGARIRHLDDPRSPLYNVWAIPADVVILFLGGNDIADHKEKQVNTIKKEVFKVVDKLIKHVCPQIFFTALEEREYDNHPRTQFRESKVLQGYNNIAKALNKRLSEHAKRTKQFRTIRVQGEFLIDRSDDSVHLTPNGLYQLRYNYRTAVMKYLKEQQQ